ncbi:MAG TPA: hypothetical protein VK866_18650 [Acidimicrobiales bacterium]|nr:hypothetical protein [Acidimicrobiales bacterium]
MTETAGPGKLTVRGTALAAALLLAAACGDDGRSANAGDATTTSDAAAAPTTGSTAPPTTAPPTTAPPTTVPPTTGPDAAPGEATGLRGGRYCEVLLVRPGTDAITAEVYNSYGLGDCPAALWDGLDPAAIAAEREVPVALLNGPRYWLMDRIGRVPGPPPEVTDFGGIEMFLAATVEIAAGAASATPYVASSVDRATTFTFDAGSRVYELRTPDGDRYVMQSWSQQVDPMLDEPALAALGSRLAPPEGWTFTTQVLDAPLRVVTNDAPASVLQDELANSYSLVPPG